MKKTFAGAFSFTILLFCILGCGIVDRVQKSVTGSENTNSNKTLTDKAVDTTLGEEKIGVPECDEVMNLIAVEVNNPDDGYIVKATKALFLNKFKESIKKSIEENKNKNGTADLAKTCSDYKKQILKYKSEEEEKKKNQ